MEAILIVDENAELDPEERDLIFKQMIPFAIRLKDGRFIVPKGVDPEKVRAADRKLEVLELRASSESPCPPPSSSIASETEGFSSTEGSSTGRSPASTE